MRKKLIIFMTGTLFALCATAQEAPSKEEKQELLSPPIYRWKDKNGTLNYSSTPPPQDIQAELLDQEKNRPSVIAPTSSFEEASQRLQQMESQRKEREETRSSERTLRKEKSRLQEEAALSREKAKRRADCEVRHRQPCNDAGEPIGESHILPLPYYRYPPHSNINPPHPRPRPPETGHEGYRPHLPSHKDSHFRPSSEQKGALPDQPSMSLPK